MAGVLSTPLSSGVSRLAQAPVDDRAMADSLGLLGDTAMAEIFSFVRRQMRDNEEASSDTGHPADHILLLQSVQAIEQALVVLKHHLIDETRRSPALDNDN